mmetsp:Transcript_113401/g.366845  ORF Transcript_113401/g.366845 Transcript_113401/m.366845 type:complete len:319 (-) Transcript_113401:3302-4258(-)
MKGACVPLALLLEEADQTRSEAHRSRRGAQGSLANKADTERSLSLSEGDDLPADALHWSLLTLGCQCRRIIRILVRIRRLLGACGGGWGREARKVWSELTTLEAASGGLAPNAALQMLGSTSLIRPIVDRFDDGHGRHVAPARCLAPAALGPQPAAAAAGRAELGSAQAWPPRSRRPPSRHLGSRTTSSQAQGPPPGRPPMRPSRWPRLRRASASRRPTSSRSKSERETLFSKLWKRSETWPFWSLNAARRELSDWRASPKRCGSGSLCSPSSARALRPSAERSRAARTRRPSRFGCERDAGSGRRRPTASSRPGWAS